MITRSQAVAAALRASRHPQADETFLLGLQSVFRQWTALNLAISHQWGGPSSDRKAEALIEEIMKNFQGPEKIYKDDISLILEDSMETDFNTLCEDGSAEEIGEILVTMWRQCAAGDFTLVNNIREKEARVAGNFRQSQGLEGGDEIDSDDENEGLDMAEVTAEYMPTMPSFSFSATQSAVAAAGTSTIPENTEDAMDTTTTEEKSPQPDPDGWEVAGRRRTKKK